jgi:hypothetical protein
MKPDKDPLDRHAEEVQRLFHEPREVSGPPERKLVIREHPAKPGHEVAATEEEHQAPRGYERRFNAAHGTMSREQYDREHAGDGEAIAHPDRFEAELIVNDADGRRLLRGPALEEYARKRFARLFEGGGR